MIYIDGIELNTEELVDIEGFEGRYKVSPEGVIVSILKDTPTVLKATINESNHGRYQVTLRDEYSRPVTRLVHRVVATTFLSNPANHNIVFHINGNKSDNRVENLRWISSTESKYGIGAVGETSPCAKLSDADVVAIREKYYYTEALVIDIAEEYDVHYSTIHSLILNKRRQEAGGPVNIEKKFRRRNRHISNVMSTKSLNSLRSLEEEGN